MKLSSDGIFRIGLGGDLEEDLMSRARYWAKVGPAAIEEGKQAVSDMGECGGDISSGAVTSPACARLMGSPDVAASFECWNSKDPASQACLSLFSNDVAAAKGCVDSKKPWSPQCARTVANIGARAIGLPPETIDAFANCATSGDAEACAKASLTAAAAGVCVAYTAGAAAPMCGFVASKAVGSLWEAGGRFKGIFEGANIPKSVANIIAGLSTLGVWAPFEDEADLYEIDRRYCVEANVAEVSLGQKIESIWQKLRKQAFLDYQPLTEPDTGIAFLHERLPTTYNNAQCAWSYYGPGEYKGRNDPNVSDTDFINRAKLRMEYWYKQYRYDPLQEAYHLAIGDITARIANDLIEKTKREQEAILRATTSAASEKTAGEQRLLDDPTGEWARACQARWGAGVVCCPCPTGRLIAGESMYVPQHPMCCRADMQADVMRQKPVTLAAPTKTSTTTSISRAALAFKDQVRIVPPPSTATSSMSQAAVAFKASGKSATSLLAPASSTATVKLTAPSLFAGVKGAPKPTTAKAATAQAPKTDSSKTFAMIAGGLALGAIVILVISKGKSK